MRNCRQSKILADYRFYKCMCLDFGLDSGNWLRVLIVSTEAGGHALTRHQNYKYERKDKLQRIKSYGDHPVSSYEEG
ncbi:hypothetical protein ISN44_As06g040430 [Arabidopsis suecica]|uniref:Uncharacterized protein n=1 Tax=Arabidopsis suecica TaxID=45249 RepID=A0A8T2CK30_ARASU|nr:hypothetical protein ISN44_As06g040430 [Arabidopsis suecica]